MHRDPARVIVRVGLLGEHRVLRATHGARRLEKRAMRRSVHAERAQDVPERLGAAVVLQAEGAARVRPDKRDTLSCCTVRCLDEQSCATLTRRGKS